MGHSTIPAPERLAELGLPDSRSVNRIDARARVTFSQVASGDAQLNAVQIDAPKILNESVRLLEQTRVLAAMAEAADRLEITTFKAFVARFEELKRDTRIISGMVDPLRPYVDDPAFAAIVATEESAEPDPDEAFEVRPDASFVRSVNSLVAFCPIQELESLGENVNMSAVAHRCRESFDWITAFVRRHTPGGRDTWRIIGRAYSEGRLTMLEAANLLEMHRPDAVAWLEAHGYARGLEQMRLSEPDRNRVYARMRQDRLLRGGAAVPNQHVIARDVLATQRIEGVDARSWVNYET